MSGTLAELVRMLEDGRIALKGEFVLIVEGREAAPSSTVSIGLDQLLHELTDALPGSQAVDIVSSLSGRGRNEVYRLMLSQSDGKEEK